MSSGVNFCSLSSGSNGNAYYIGNRDEAILVDAGISRKQIKMRLERLCIDVSKIKGIFVSHEHADHVRGIENFVKHNEIKVFTTKKTYLNFRIKVPMKNIVFFEPGELVEFGGFKVHTFLKNHDAAQPCSFVVELQEKKIGVFTDIGSACGNLKKHVSMCSAMFLESNYDVHMLKTGKYPPFLKKRVIGANGHLSNIQALELLKENMNNELEIVLLSHISNDNNTPEIAMDAFNEMKEKMRIEIAHRYKETVMYHI